MGGAKLNISMITGFLTPGGPVLVEFITPKYFNKYKKNMDAYLENISFAYVYVHFLSILEKRGTDKSRRIV